MSDTVATESASSWSEGSRPPAMFAGAPRTRVVVPDDPTFASAARLLRLERHELTALLGTPVEFATGSTLGDGEPEWRFSLDAGQRRPVLTFDAERSVLASRGADADALIETISLLPTLARCRLNRVEAIPLADCRSAVRRVEREVGDSYPAFGLRGIEWDSVCDRHRELVCSADDQLAAAQRWLAELDDAHTWVYRTGATGTLPYSLHLAHEPVFTRVPPRSAAYERGVRRGWRLADVDGARPRVPEWLARTGASGHAKPLVAGRRLLGGPPGTARSLTAVSPGGSSVQWEEEPAPPLAAGGAVSWKRVDRVTGYVRLDAWAGDSKTKAELGGALAELRRCPTLVVDLRANVGGNLVFACETRDRFLRGQTLLGSVAYCVGGRLSERYGIIAEPSPPENRWRGRLLVLADALTYSSSEDFLLGLQGLPHVTLVGEATGGGSGRARNLPLFDDWRLSVSTALTFDRDGRCVEGRGLQPDVRFDDFIRSATPRLRAALRAFG